MPKILSLETLPGTHRVPIDRMADIYDEIHAEKEKNSRTDNPDPNDTPGGDLL